MQFGKHASWAVLLVVGARAVPSTLSAQVRPAETPPILIGEAVKPHLALNAPGRRPAGVAWGEKLLWVVDAEERVVFAVDPSTGEVVGPAISLPGLENPGPAAFDASLKVLWIVDDPAARVARGDPKLHGREPRIARIPVQQPGQSCFTPITPHAATGIISGIGWDGEANWICMRGGLCAALIRVDPSQDFGVSLATSAGCDPLALTIDPDYQSLWIATGSGDDGEVLLLERSLIDQRDTIDRPVSVLTTKRFLSLDPTVRPTDIAATGRAIWVLDSGQRKLFRVDVY